MLWFILATCVLPNAHQRVALIVDDKVSCLRHVHAASILCGKII